MTTLASYFFQTYFEILKLCFGTLTRAQEQADKSQRKGMGGCREINRRIYMHICIMHGYRE